MDVDQPRLRVLVVENEVLLRLTAEDMLMELGHEIVGWASRAHMAIAEAERTQPDIVLMDIHGVDAAREIRSRLGIASLFMTGASDKETYRRALLTQPLGYLRKPLLLPDLKSALDSLVGVPHRGGAPSALPSSVANVQFVSFAMTPKAPPDSFD